MNKPRLKLAKIVYLISENLGTFNMQNGIVFYDDGNKVSNFEFEAVLKIHKLRKSKSSQKVILHDINNEKKAYDMALPEFLDMTIGKNIKNGVVKGKFTFIERNGWTGLVCIE